MELANARRIKDGFRIIPIFREGNETTSYLSDHRYLDFRIDNDNHKSFAELLQWLFNKVKPPTLGNFSFESEREAINYARELIKLARKEFEKKNYLEAQKKLEISVHLDPDDVSSLGLYGRTLTNLGRFDESIDPLTRAIELTQFSTNRIIYLLCRLISNYYRCKYNLAIEDGNRIIELSPNHKEGHRLRATTWVVMEFFDRAIADINVALEAKQNYLYGHAIKAIILHKTNDIAQALKEIDICTTLQPKDGVDFYCLSLAYANIGNYDVAKEMLTKSKQYDIKCLPRAKVDPLFIQMQYDPGFENSISTHSPDFEPFEKLEE